jgi:hypothetical protein
MLHATRIAMVMSAVLCGTASAAEETKQRAPSFADYPVKAASVRIARPLVPKSWDEDPRLRLLDSVPRGTRSNFAGPYFMAVWGCGSACVVGAIVDARTGRIIPLPTVSGWKEVDDDFQGIAFRKNSRLVVMSGERDEKGDVGQHFYVLEGGRLRFLKTIKSDGNFMTVVE